MTNFSISVPFEVAMWLNEYAKVNKLYHAGKPSPGMAASAKLQEAYSKENPK